MSTLTPRRPATRPGPAARAVLRESPRSVPPLASWVFLAAQAGWLATVVAAAIVVGGSVAGFAALWLVGAAVVATLGFGYREQRLHDRPQPSSSR